MNNIPQKPYKPLTPFGLFVRHNFPFVEATYEARDNYDLLCKVYKQLMTVEYDQGIAQENINTLYEFLNTLELQDEVNNKLDEMAESGQLQEIMASYLNSKAVFGFDNVSDLKTATNLIDGSYAKTLGYTTKNDCGAGLYKIRTITNDDVVDNASIIPLNDTTLIAELITNKEITPEQFGCYGDATHNDTTALQNCFDFASTHKCKIVLSNKYLTDDDLEISRGVTIEGKTMNASIIGDTSNSIKLKGGSATSAYANGSDATIFSRIYFDKITVILGDTTDDWGSATTFNKCIFFGNNQTSNGIIVKNHSWIFSIIDCKIANYTNGIYFAFTNIDDSYVVDSGAAIKIDNTDIYNCNKCVYLKGAANDGYDIQITNCDFEHSHYSIYVEDGRGNNIQCKNLHIEGNTYGSIYTQTSNIYIDGIWDFNSNPETFIANYTAIDGGRIIINSGRINYENNKLAKNIGSKIYINVHQVVMPAFLYNKPILTDDSTAGVIVPDGSIYELPTAIATKNYASTQVGDLTTIEKGSNNGCIIDMILRQTDSLSSENTPTMSVFMSSTTGTKGFSIPLVKNNCYVHLVIEYREHMLRVYSSYLIDGLTESPIFEREDYFETDTTAAAKTIQLRYNYGVGTLATKKVKATALNGYELV